MIFFNVLTVFRGRFLLFVKVNFVFSILGNYRHVYLKTDQARIAA